MDDLFLTVTCWKLCSHLLPACRRQHYHRSRKAQGRKGSGEMQTRGLVLTEPGSVGRMTATAQAGLVWWQMHGRVAEGTDGSYRIRSRDLTDT